MTPNTRDNRLSLGRFATLCLLVALGGAVAPARAADGEIRGTISDAAGGPVREYRVVAREDPGTGVHVSSPSDAAGQYVVAVPAGKSYRIVAVLTPTGGRLALESPELVQVDGPVVLDVTLPVAQAERPRSFSRGLGGVDRLFLGFVEDPALVDHVRIEVQAEMADFDQADRLDGRAIFALQPGFLPGVEVGLQGGFAQLDQAGQSEESGATDLEGWAKIHLFRSADNRFDFAAGARLTFPTGDEDAGLSQDSLQSKLFASMAYSFQSAEIIAHAGLRATETGETSGVSLEGRVSASVGVGVIVPFTESFSLSFEANYEGERFENVEKTSLVSFGANYHVGQRSIVRAALAAGIEDGSPDGALLVGYAASF